ncbi:MAG: hypothetical protein ACOVQ2_01615 [Flavobacterium sp.]|jgi:hypothetical protein
MKKIVLTTEDITFIENYLTNNRVTFTDIKAEMIDHIAIAVEEKMQTESLDFYDAFKEYMIKNKKEIMKMNKETSLDFNFSAFKSFGKFLIKPVSVILFLLINIFYFNFFSNFISKSFFNFLFIFSVISLIIIMYFNYWKRKIRIYQLEKNFSIFFVFYHLFNPIIFLTKNTDYIIIGLFFLTYLYINYIIYFYINLKKYQKI